MNQSFEKAGARLMNMSNKKIIIELIMERKGISRSDLGKITVLSVPYIERIVDELIEQDQRASYIGIGNFSGGCPPMMVKFNSENNYIIGIDLVINTYNWGIS
jgi:hypothetical protein